MLYQAASELGVEVICQAALGMRFWLWPGLEELSDDRPYLLHAGPPIAF